MPAAKLSAHHSTPLPGGERSSFAPSHAVDVIPDVVERADAPLDFGTPYRITAGQLFGGTITPGDEDAVAVNLVAGVTYEFFMTGNGRNPLPDTILALFDPKGYVVAENDDYGWYLDESYFTFTATQTGTYLIGAAGYGSSAGEYVLGFQSVQVQPDPPPGSGEVWTMDEIASQLSHGYWQHLGLPTPTFAVEQGQSLTVDLSGLNAQGQSLARSALDAWSQLTGINFDTSSRAGSGAHIVLDDNDPSGAYTQHLRIRGSTTEHVAINIPSSWHGAPADGIATYAYSTFLHEIGHALGLGHAGNYNGNAAWGRDNLYANDSLQATVMSYFSQDQNPNIDASAALPISPMPADIIAIQNLYGMPAGVMAGATIWGVGGTTTGAFGAAMTMLTQRRAVTMTIFDQGGIDTLDLRNDTTGQRIDLRPGSISDVYGRIGNLLVERNTLIEHAVAGAGADHVTGNFAGNHLQGRAGNDTLLGLGGDDTLDGGPGADRLVGGAGNDLYITDGNDVIVEASGEGYDTVHTTHHWAMAANIEAARVIGNNAANIAGNGLSNSIIGNDANNQLSGGAGDDTLHGGGGDDLLVGDAGNDRLVGDAGRDTLRGGAGNDTYIFDGVDLIVESANQGWDIVESRNHYTLTAHVEELRLMGANNVNGAGNAQANRLVGNAGNNQIWGGAGNDTLLGGPGDDLLVGDAGNDRLNGEGGRDTLRGGAGDDTYIFDGVDLIVESANEGWDIVESWNHYSLTANVEELRLMGANHVNAAGNELANRLVGNAGNNQMWGGAGDDFLEGGAGDDRLVGDAGRDTLRGGTGNDTYVFDGVDLIVENPNEGWDIVESWNHYTLTAHVEELRLMGVNHVNGAGNAQGNRLVGNAGNNQMWGGAGDDTLLGGPGNDLLVGDAGNDRLNGEGGRDTLRGGAGNDTYVFDGVDLIVENANEGWDIVESRNHYTLTAHVEELRLMGANHVNGAGNELANRLVGNAGNNQMWGGAGNDTLLGGAGGDLLVGDAGDDWLEGGAGYDRLRGGAGADTFVFATNEGGHAMDFQDGVDTVLLRRGPGFESATLPQLLSHAENVAEGVQFTFGATMIVISGATIATLQDDLVLG